MHTTKGNVVGGVGQSHDLHNDEEVGNSLIKQNLIQSEWVVENVEELCKHIRVAPKALQRCWWYSEAP